MSSNMALLHNDVEYRAWIDMHYSLRYFDKVDGEALISELMPRELPCIAFFVSTQDMSVRLPIFIPVDKVRQCLEG